MALMFSELKGHLVYYRTHRELRCDSICSFTDCTSTKGGKFTQSEWTRSTHNCNTCFNFKV